MLVLIAFTPTSVHAAGVPLRQPGQKIVKAPDQKEIKAPEQTTLADGSVRKTELLADGTTKITTIDRQTQLGKFGKTEEKLIKTNGAIITTTTDKGRFRDDITIVTEANGRTTTQEINDFGAKIVSFKSTQTTWRDKDGSGEMLSQVEVGVDIYAANAKLEVTGGSNPLTGHGYIGLAGKGETLGGWGPGINAGVALGAGKTGADLGGKLAGAKLEAKLYSEKNAITDARTNELTVEGKAKWTGNYGVKLSAQQGEIADETRKQIGNYGAGTITVGKEGKLGVMAGAGERTIYGEGTQIGVFGGVSKKLGDGTATGGTAVLYDTKTGTLENRDFGGATNLGGGLPDFGKSDIPLTRQD